jgi:hypothetical protein
MVITIQIATIESVKAIAHAVTIVRRHYASLAAGFECLPATVVPLADLLDPSKELGWRT